MDRWYDVCSQAVTAILGGHRWRDHYGLPLSSRDFLSVRMGQGGTFLSSPPLTLAFSGSGGLGSLDLN